MMTESALRFGDGHQTQPQVTADATSSYSEGPFPHLSPPQSLFLPSSDRPGHRALGTQHAPLDRRAVRAPTTLVDPHVDPEWAKAVNMAVSTRLDCRTRADHCPEARPLAKFCPSDPQDFNNDRIRLEVRRASGRSGGRADAPPQPPPQKDALRPPALANGAPDTQHDATILFSSTQVATDTMLAAIVKSGTTTLGGWRGGRRRDARLTE